MFHARTSEGWDKVTSCFSTEGEDRRMKKTLVLGSAALLAVMSSTARADAFLSLNNGATTVSCNTSLAFNAANCGAGFTAIVGGNTISFSGAVGGYSVFQVQVVSNTPGSPVLGFATDTKTQVQNNSAGATALTVAFAVNNFTNPVGSPLTLSASQTGNFITGSAGMQQTFTGWGNAANTLGVGVGTAAVTPVCVAAVASPPTTDCSTSSGPTQFVRAGPYALNGIEVINMSQGGVASFTGSIAVTPVPEPSTVVLMAAGLFGLVGGRRMLRRRIA